MISWGKAAWKMIGLAALAGVFSACDDSGEPSQSQVSVEFIAPTRAGELLGCADDGDPATLDFLEYDVSVLVRLKGADTAGLVARLRQVGQSDSQVEAEVPISGTVTFPRYRLNLGDQTLAVEIVRGVAVLASSERRVIAALDPADPACAEGPTLTFVQPTDGAVLDASGDANLADDLQIDVEVAVAGAVDGDVRLEVNGAEAGAAAVDAGTVRFSGVTLPIGDGAGTASRLAAVATGAAGQEIRTEIGVTVQVPGCALTVTPADAGPGCALTEADDEDAAAPGVQVTFAAETDCGQVAFQVNGLATELLDVVDGRVETVLTLEPGANNIQATATTAGGLETTLDPYTLTVGPAAPASLDLALNAGLNAFTLADADPNVDGVQWTVRGTSAGLNPGTVVTAGDLEGEIQADGSFALVVPGPYACPVQIQASATDVCGAGVSSPGYQGCFDGVQPVLTIVEPGDDAIPVDADADLPGLQVAVRVRVDDPRATPETDYEIRVECGTDGVFHDRTDTPANRDDRDDRDEVTIAVSFIPADAGEIRCRATAAPTPNPIINPAVGFRIDFGRPTFNLRQPIAGPDPQCLDSGRVRIAGDGNDLSANNAQLTATLLGRGAEPIDVPLIEEGPDRYGATLGEMGQPAALADGQYAVAVTGDSAAGPVLVNPAAAVTFFVDTRPPQLSLAEPAGPLGLANDANGDLDDCVQTTLTLSAVDQRATEVCVRVNDGAESCGPVDAAGLRVTEEVSLLPGQNVLHLRGTDCAGNEATTDVVVQTVGCGGADLSLFITAPGDGESVRAAQDEDPAVAGCQIDVRAGGEGFEAGADFVVCTDVDQGAGPAACGGDSSASRAPCVSAGGAGQNLTCPVTLTDGTHRLRVVSTGPDRTASAAVTVRADCTAPTVVSAVVAEDDGDGCINRQERLNDVQNGGDADLTVRFETIGLEDGRTVAVRQQPGDVAVGRGVVAGDVGAIDIQLPEGQHTLYLQATDAAGNPLPGAGGANLLVVEVDTTAPTPSLVNLMAGQCLNAAADVDMAPGLQAPVQVRTGREEGELVTVALDTGDGAVDPVETDRARLDFPAISMPEGDVDLVVTVVDACGNVGSVGGFAPAGDADDWQSPLPVALRVDTVPPAPALEGVEEGRVYTLDDDANADASDGLQLAVRVSFPGDGAEDGRPITIRSGAQALVTTPSPLPANGGQPVDALLTLPDGDHALSAQVTDACGNAGRSPITNIRAEAGGCASALVGLDGGVVYGPGDGVEVPGGLQIDVEAQVALVCAAGTARLLVDGAPVGDPVLVGAGAVVFRDVVLAPGEHLLAVRVSLLGQATDSQPARVVVDLTAPTVRVSVPAGPDPAVILDDEDAAPGLQTQVAAEVVEAPEDSPRVATLEIDGAVVAGPLDVGPGSPTIVDFGLVTIPTGPSTLRVCVADAGGNEGCGERQIEGDGGAPGVVDPVVDIRNRRRPRLQFSFVAPGDDGAGGGRVVRYRFRTARQPIVTEADWQAATAILATRATVDPGQLEVISTTGLLTVNAVHHIAIRAVDDRDREGPWVSVPVDLTMPTATFDLAPGAGWGGDDFFNAGSLVEGPGDLDGDGRADALVYGNRITGEAAAAVVFGAADPAAAELVELEVAPNTIYHATDGGSLGDVNGDGAPDVALLGYSPDFANTRVAIYLGCPAGGGCDRADVATPDTVIVVPGRVASFVTGVGDFFGDGGFGDVLIGGSPAGGGNTAFIVGGRAAWPAEVDATALDAAAGQLAIEVPQANAGVFGAGAGDLDGDGRDDLALTAGGNLDAVFVFYGAANPPDTLRFVDAGDRAVALVNPCSAQPGTFGTWLAGGADVTGDGAPDLLIGARSFKQIAVFDSDLAALECFGRPEVQFGVNFDLAGDVDGDGDIDLLVTHRDDQGRPQDAFLFYNDGAGRFGGRVDVPREPQARFSQPNRPRFGAAGLGDFNGDGFDDVATVYKLAGGALRLAVHY